MKYAAAIPFDIALMTVHLLGFVHRQYVPWLLICYGGLNILFMIAMVSKLKTWFTGVLNPFDSLPLNLLCFFNAVVHYGFIYYFLGITGPHWRPLPNLAEAVYFSFVTVATVGYGDFVPLSLVARILTVSEIVFAFWFVVTVLPVSIAEQFELLRYKKESFVRFMDEFMAAERRGEFRKVTPPKQRKPPGLFARLLRKGRK